MFRKLLPVIAAPLLLVAACGSSEDALQLETASPVAAVQQAPDAATAAGSAHVELSMDLAGLDADQSMTITGSGDYDTDAGVVAMQLDLGDAFASLGALGGKDVPAGLDEPMQFVVSGTTAYLKMPFLTALTGKTGWLSVPLDQLGESGLGDLGGFGAGTDPGAMLDFLRGAGEVTEAGHEDIDGVATTKYTATVDLDKALADVPAAQREELQSKIDELGDGLASMPITVWLDADGLPRRLQVATDQPKTGSMTMTISWSKYGEPVSVDVPDPSEVTAAKDVLGGFAGSFLDQK